MRLASAILALSTVAAAAQNAVPILPDLSKTPGPADPRADVCNSLFSTKALRRARRSDRRCVLSRYGGKPFYAFTYDHLVPLELGGADSCDNLWPEPQAEARRKDQLEDALRAHVCHCGDISLVDAQNLIRRNWIAGYARFVTPKGSSICATNSAPNS